MGDLGKKKIRVFLVDDHKILLESLHERLEKEEDMTVCGVAESANEAIKLMGKAKPHVAVVDLNLRGGAGGLELIKAVKERFPLVKCLVLSMHEEELFAERAMRAGAVGYVMKSELTKTLVEAIRRAMQGKVHLSEELSSRMLTYFVSSGKEKSVDPVQTLTDRELEIFRLVGQGNKASGIARMLNVSVKTVDAHRLHIREKLNLKNGTELVKYAIEWINKN